MSADVREQAKAFFAYAMSGKASGPVVLGNVHDPLHGWRTFMRVGDKALAFNPGFGRKMARDCTVRSRDMFSKMPEAERKAINPESVFSFFNDLDAQCKETMALRSSGATPADVNATPQGTA